MGLVMHGGSLKCKLLCAVPAAPPDLPLDRTGLFAGLSAEPQQNPHPAHLQVGGAAAEVPRPS